MTEMKIPGGLPAFTGHSVGSRTLQENQEYCLVCDDVLVKCESKEEGDPPDFCWAEQEQSFKPGSCFGGGCDEFEGVGMELVANKFCELFGVIGPVKRWMAAKDLDKERSLFCEGCGAQVKILIELKRRVEQLEEKLEEGKIEIRKLVKKAEGRGGDELRRSQEIRRIRQKILRGRDGSRSGLQTKTLSDQILARRAVVLISQAERRMAEECQAFHAAKVDAPEDTLMDVSDFQCSSDSEDSLYAPPRRRRRKRSRVSKTNTVYSGNLTDDNDADKVDEDLNSDGKKPKSHLKDGIYTYQGTTLRICDDDNGKTSLFNCDSCGDLVFPANLRHHIRSKHIIEQCKICGKVCSFATLKNHLRCVHSPKLRTCSICGKPNMTSVNLKRHTWTHLNSEEKLEYLVKEGDRAPAYAKLWNRSVCDICGVTVRANRLPGHMQTVHATQEDRKVAMRICPICGKAVTNLCSHMQCNHSEKKYPCPYCENKIFDSKHSLRRHIRNSHRSKSFHCTICDRAFTHQNVLEAHMNCHLGIRPFSCDHCEMTFTAKLYLQKHTRVYHTEGREPPRRKSYVRGPDRRKKATEG